MRILYILSFLIAATALSAQNITDALRLSSLDYSGTARFVATGSSMGTLGADFGSLTTNPAGLAAFRRSEFILSPSLRFDQANTYLKNAEGNTLLENESTLGLHNMGAVFVWNPTGSEWRSVNIGIGFNRIADFNRSMAFLGRSDGSITQRFIERSNGNAPDFLDAFEAGPAYDAYVTFVDTSTNEYGADLPPGAQTLKSQDVFTDGSLNELSFGIAGNYQEKLLIGFSIGVPFVDFTEEKFYLEENENPGVFNTLEYNEFLNSTGVGINFKLGMIYKIENKVHISAAVHSPTWYTLNDNFYTSVTYDYDFDPDLFPAAGPQTAYSPDGEFDYGIRTPWRIQAGLASVINRSGFISAEIEWVDYDSANFNLRKSRDSENYRDLERELNEDIDNQLESAFNIRIGGEWAVQKFRVRAGFGLEGTPFVNDNDFSNTYSGGIGWRENNFFIDLAVRYRESTFSYVPYLLEDEKESPLVSSELQTTNVVMTLGFKF